MSVIAIKNGRIIDPANRRDEIADLWIQNGVIVDKSKVQDSKSKVDVIDAAGRVVAPGLIDLHVHLREPGQSHKETIATGTAAAAAGGFTTVVCMPNTHPPADNAGTITWIRERAAQTAVVNVFCTGAITKGLEGEELAPIGSMAGAGIVAITDDGHCVQSHEVMRRALEYARMFELPLLDHCQEYSLVGNGVMHEGDWSVRLGLPGWPRIGEEIIVARNVLLAELCGARIHCQHISSGGSIRLLREAKARGVPISGEVCPHHLALTDETLKGFDSNYKMNPPLRTREDIELLLEGIADGTIDILASDHAPHARYEKEVELDHAPFGITGLETEFAAFCNLLVHQRRTITLPRLIELLTINPARLLRLDRGTLTVGAPADVTVIDPDLEWTFDRDESRSLSKNTPFHGMRFKGRAVRTMVGGKSVWELGA
jgi:dihydroorotase